MIRCRPKGICSWDFFLDGEGHHASLDFNWLSEQGAITADGTSFEVCKHGVLSGQWTLDHAWRHHPATGFVFVEFDHVGDSTQVTLVLD